MGLSTYSEIGRNVFAVISGWLREMEASEIHDIVDVAEVVEVIEGGLVLGLRESFDDTFFIWGSRSSELDKLESEVIDVVSSRFGVVILISPDVLEWSFQEDMVLGSIRNRLSAARTHSLESVVKVSPDIAAVTPCSDVNATVSVLSSWRSEWIGGQSVTGCNS